MLGKTIKKILIIDDEADLVTMLRTRLEANHFKVIVAKNGREGLLEWKKHSPDLIILDVSMPEMDGYTFIQEFKSINGLKDVPIIVLTAKSHMKDIFKIEGVKDYIIKPFDKTELLAKINRALDLLSSEGGKSSDEK